MELQNSFMKLCKFIVKTTDFYGTISFCWNNELNEISVKARNKRVVRKLFLNLIGLFTIIQGLQIVYSWERSDTFGKSYSMLMVSSWFFAVPSCYEDVIKPKRVAALLNAMADFEFRHRNVLQNKPNKAYTRYGQFTKLLCKAMACTVHVMWFFAINVVINPCFAAYPGYMLSLQCRETMGFLPHNNWNDRNEIYSRLGIMIPTFIIWLNIIAPTLILACMATIKGFCIASYIRSYSEELENVKSITKETYEIAMMQMEIRLILVYFREIYAKRELGGLAFGGVFGQSILLFIPIEMVRSGLVYDQPFITIACSWAAIGLGIIFLALFGNVGQVYSTSEYWTLRIRQNSVLFRNAWFRKYFRSCPILRVYFGPSNFVEPRTPMNIEHVVLDTTMNLVLVHE